MMDYRKFLRDELLRRQSKNRSYSLRAFARDLGMSSSRLSEILNGKVGVSETRAAVLAERLQLSLEDRDLFVDLVESEHARSSILRAAASERVKARFANVPVIKEEEMNLMSDWHHLPLLELISLKNIEHTPEAFAQKLNLDVKTVEESLALLERLGYLQKQDGQWLVTEPTFTTSNNIPSPAIKRYHTQMLEKSREALLHQEPSERDFTSMVFAMDSEQLEYAKKKMRDFRRTLVQELDAFPRKDKVYYLSMNMFSLTEEQRKD
jgi:hypothetical protein, TIGR02147